MSDIVISVVCYLSSVSWFYFKWNIYKDNSMKPPIIDFIALISAHESIIFWWGAAILAFSLVFLELSGISLDLLLGLGLLLVLTGFASRLGKAILSKIACGKFD